MEPGSGESPQAARQRVLEATIEQGTLENKVADEIALALERVGAMVMAGGIPLCYVLAQIAPRIVQDWGLCSKLVEEVIRQEKQPIYRPSRSSGNKIWFPRLHGQWLAYAAAIWLERN